jgi:hypothetical protein
MCVLFLLDGLQPQQDGAVLHLVVVRGRRWDEVLGVFLQDGIVQPSNVFHRSAKQWDAIMRLLGLHEAESHTLAVIVPVHLHAAQCPLNSTSLTWQIGFEGLEHKR